MKNPKVNLNAVLLALASVLTSVWTAGLARAQPSIGTVTDFSTSEHYDTPNQHQMKWLLSGAKAEPLPDGRMRISEAKLQTFLTNGLRQIVVEAPECIYDQGEQEAGSTGPLQVQSGDGRVAISGTGFRWEQIRECLTISNQVRATVRREATNAPTVQPLVITSRWFTFEATNRSAVFHDGVRGEDPDMEFTCGQLAIRAAPGSGSLELVEAEQSPVIISRVDGRRATADRLIYTRAGERAELVGNATWQQGRQSGRADRAVVHRREKDFAAHGNVAMKLPRESLAAGGLLLAGTNAPVTPDTNTPPVDLFADHFHSRSNLLVAEGAVRLADATNQLSCDRLTVQSATGGGTDETAVAEGNVLVERSGGNLRADRAVYTRSDAAIVFTGNPRWAQPQMEGRAEQITVHNESGQIHAENQVAVKVKLAQGPSALEFFSSVGKTRGESQVIEIFAREFTAENRVAIFLGDVHAHESPITGGEARLRSDTLELQLSADGQRAERITAKNHVVFEQGRAGATNGPDVYRTLTSRTLTATPSAQTNDVMDLVAEGDVLLIEPGITARSERAVYVGATDTVKLTGNPVVVVEVKGNPAEKRPPGILTVTEAEVLIWDRRHGRYSGKGCQLNFEPLTAKQAAGRQH